MLLGDLNDVTVVSKWVNCCFAVKTLVSDVTFSSEPRDRAALEALRLRDDDKVALEFFKKRKAVEAQSQAKD